ncbi:hypothetical protein [Natrononativus amylolyticus]|uniref:hypothetical protein n=1 Tax=Natrononativus amylolyticus TaxID=2963434 RepID=UPI0020CBB49A|nr:hypothetical protein [Natrononativus amylolyticus]
MSDRTASVLEGLRQPEYTGENRCTPCTVLNVAIAVLVGGALALVVPAAGVVALACSLLIIYLRGYLVPGTPELTERFLPDSVLARFDHHETRSEPPTFETLEKLEYERAHSVDPEEYLLEAGALELRADGEAYRLTGEFADRVDGEMADYRDGVGRETVADLFGVEPEAVTVEDRDYPAFTVERRVRKWPARGALIADAATHDALAERTDDWGDVPVGQRVEILELLRSFHESCPLCGGPVAMDETIVDSCCRSYEVVTLGCLDCGERLLEFDPEAVDASETDKGIVP